jgi:hypothetical protein
MDQKSINRGFNISRHLAGNLIRGLTFVGDNA